MQTICDVSLPGPAVWTAAADLQKSEGLSFWDALLVSAAVASGAQKLYSEDMQLRTIRGMSIVNPFA